MTRDGTFLIEEGDYETDQESEFTESILKALSESWLFRKIERFARKEQFTQGVSSPDGRSRIKMTDSIFRGLCVISELKWLK